VWSTCCATPATASSRPSRGAGVDTITRAGLADALAGADVVVDVTDSPTPEDGAAFWFFSTSTAHVLSAEREAGVAHHVGLSILGADPLSSYDVSTS